MADPAYEKDEIRVSRTALGHLASDVIEEQGRILIADFAVDWRHLKQSVRSDKLLAEWLKTFRDDDSYRLEIRGFSDSIGNERNNLHLRNGRARNVLALLDPETRKRVITSGPAPLGTFVGDNDSVAGRARNRSVEIRFQKEITINPQGPLSARSCLDVAKPNKTITDFLLLLRCIEQAFPQFTPRVMLSLLRQRCYGDEAWSCTRRPQWAAVISCGVKLKDPRSIAATPLLQGLCSSSNGKVQVVDGVDMGHVLTGLEAMVCPRASFPFPVKFWGVPLSPNPKLANEEFATWVGDLGSAAAQRVLDRGRSGTAKPWNPNYIFGDNSKASEADLLGDVDSYSIRQGLLGIDCKETRLKPLPIGGQKISEIFEDYYLSQGNLAGNKDKRFSCFLSAIGGRIAGGTLTNQGWLAMDIAPRIFRAAELFHAREAALRPAGSALRAAADEISALFVEWLVLGLSTE